MSTICVRSAAPAGFEATESQADQKFESCPERLEFVLAVVEVVAEF